eukprot:5734517-Pleurochrysis_carterae.AAC.1
MLARTPAVSPLLPLRAARVQQCARPQVYTCMPTLRVLACALLTRTLLWTMMHRGALACAHFPARILARRVALAL